MQKSIFVDFRLSKPPKTKRTSIQYYKVYLNDFKDDQGDGDGFISFEKYYLAFIVSKAATIVYYVPVVSVLVVAGRKLDTSFL